MLAALRHAGLAVCALALVGATVARAATPLHADPDELTRAIEQRLSDVPHLAAAREMAQARGLRVWLFGGTAAAYAHYVKWDLLRRQGDPRFQGDRFDYDFTNIFRSTQDLDLVADGSPEQVQELERAVSQRFPFFMGSKSRWEVRALRHAVSDKEALLRNPDFLNQHTDSHSTGMIELTASPGGESRIRDLRDWDTGGHSQFLRDVAEGKLRYYFSQRHEETPRFKKGINPPILSVVRYFTKAFQFELELREEDLATVRRIISQLPVAESESGYVDDWLERNAPKLFRHAIDIAYAWNTLEDFGLREKLLARSERHVNRMEDPGMDPAPARQREGSLAWWMSKEPLRDSSDGGRPEGRPSTGRTAAELGIETVTHETRDFQTWEAIRRSHKGTPNVFISRAKVGGRPFPGETAAYGDGFYTRIGRKGAAGTGYHIRFTVRPDAREGVDFFLATEDYVVWLTRDKLEIMPESLSLTPAQIIAFLLDAENQDERGVKEFFKSRLEKSASLEATVADQLAAQVDVLLPEPVYHRGIIQEVLLSPTFQNNPRWDAWVDEILRIGHPQIAHDLEQHLLPSDRARQSPRWMDWVRILVQRGAKLSSVLLPALLDKKDPRWPEILRLALEHRQFSTNAYSIGTTATTEEARNLINLILTRREVMAHASWPEFFRLVLARYPAAAETLVERLALPDVMAHPEWPGLVEAALLHPTTGPKARKTLLEKVLNQDAVIAHPSWPRWMDHCIRLADGETRPLLVEALIKKVDHPRWAEWMGKIIHSIEKEEDARAGRSSYRLQLLANPQVMEKFHRLALPDGTREAWIDDFVSDRQFVGAGTWNPGLQRLIHALLNPTLRSSAKWESWIASLCEHRGARGAAAEYLLSEPSLFSHPRYWEWVALALTEEKNKSDNQSIRSRFLEHVFPRPELAADPRLETWISRFVEDKSMTDDLVKHVLAKKHVVAHPQWSHWAKTVVQTTSPSWNESRSAEAVATFLAHPDVRGHPAWPELFEIYFRPEAMKKPERRRAGLFHILPHAANHPKWPEVVEKYVLTGDLDSDLMQFFKKTDVVSSAAGQRYLEVWKEALEVEKRYRRDYIRGTRRGACEDHLLGKRIARWFGH